MAKRKHAFDINKSALDVHKAIWANDESALLRALYENTDKEKGLDQRLVDFDEKSINRHRRAICDSSDESSSDSDDNSDSDESSDSDEDSDVVLADTQELFGNDDNGRGHNENNGNNNRENGNNNNEEAKKEKEKLQNEIKQLFIKYQATKFSARPVNVALLKYYDRYLNSVSLLPDDSTLKILLNHETTRHVGDVASEDSPQQLAFHLLERNERVALTSAKYLGVKQILNLMSKTCQNKWESEKQEKQQVTERSWGRLLNDSKHADVTIQCPDGQVMAHKCVLASAVPYFERAFSNAWKETSTGIWKTDKPCDIMRGIVNYIYTGTLKDEYMKDNAMETLLLAREYQIQALEEKCQHFIANAMTATNVCHILQFASGRCVDELKNKCLDFMKENPSSILAEANIAGLISETPNLWKDVQDHFKDAPTKRRKITPE